MNVLVDTPVWSLALRRKPQHLNQNQQTQVIELQELIHEGRAKLVGPIRQELLSGIRDPQVYEKLRSALRAFEDEALDRDDFEAAAQAFNACAAKGVAGSAIDFLLCAVALQHSMALFTSDADFPRYARHLPLRLHRPRAAMRKQP